MEGWAEREMVSRIGREQGISRGNGKTYLCGLRIGRFSCLAPADGCLPMYMELKLIVCIGSGAHGSVKTERWDLVGYKNLCFDPRHS